MSIITFLSSACAVALLIPSNVDAAQKVDRSVVQGKLRGGIDRQLQKSDWCLAGDIQEACKPLMAGQFEDIGTVCIREHPDDLDKIQVTYSLKEESPCGSWQLNEVHLYVGDTYGGIPTNIRGNPMIGTFPFTDENLGTTTKTFDLQLGPSIGDYSCLPDTPDKTFYVAAHASVKCYDSDGYLTDEQTAWPEGGSMVDRGSWATSFTFDLSCDCVDNPDAPGSSCETAFAKDSAGSTCFLGIDENGNYVGDTNNDGKLDGDFNTWGWTQQLSFDTSASYSLAIYAGAGQCDTTKGTYVGDLSVVYNNPNWDVTWTTFAPYTTDEAHLYIGSAILPENNGAFTVAPGQYDQVETNLGNVTSYTISIPAADVLSNYYIVAHSVTCGF